MQWHYMEGSYPSAKGPPTEQREEVMGLALHSLRSLLSLHHFPQTSYVEFMVDEVELLQANHRYAGVRLTDGRETSVSSRHLSPAGRKCVVDDKDEKREKPGVNDPTPENFDSKERTATNDKSHEKPPRHYTRRRRTPKCLLNYVQH
ncbi:hypothetical protein T4E_8249 [Trichinella pseudospiralis]|uniref:Uncharacterized protein n=1 Tax=Trichinella pseudospiralis TaxID=6337 RepID=A0A0V0Y554_TRIPS|nr:hypothetical protein T4E_8249 [Trichinella pseudospiralis]